MMEPLLQPAARRKLPALQQPAAAVHTDLLCHKLTVGLTEIVCLAGTDTVNHDMSLSASSHSMAQLSHLSTICSPKTWSNSIRHASLQATFLH